jgi:hypothetical protein
VSTSPAVATLTLDGAPVANPLDASFPKGGQHSLAASAVGHQSVTKTVSFDRDVKVSLQLRPEPVRRAAAPVARPVRPAPPPPQRAAPPPPVLTIQKQPAPAKKTKGAGFVADSPY